MKIGSVKEIKKFEYRVGLTPDNVRSYVNAGHQVYIERNAGVGSGFMTDDYIKAGATILETAREVWETAEMIVKVKEPLPDEYQYFRKGQIIYTYLHLAADRALTDAMLAAGVKGVAYETLDQNGYLPLLAPMSQIAGRLSVQEGAKYLEKIYGGSGVLLSGVPGTPKAHVVIIGGGSVGTNACKIAVGMGADVTVMDVNIHRLEYLDDIFGARIQTLYSNDVNVENALKTADLVVGAVLIPGKKAPKIIRKSYLKEMRPGSVIVDVAVDQGGCCETTHMTYHDDPIYKVDGVVHYCVGNMPGAVPRTSTIALTNATLSYGLQIAANGLEEACRRNETIYSAINTYDGKLTCKNVADSFKMEYTDIHSCF
ncbi:MAG TPA: alanine dehydrogenase [Candidatus Negativibacillus faecipullorum]|nr:alanine dehydrogenase [Candidatus Negativibacillus faecipullorum]